MKREEAKVVLYEWQKSMVEHGVPIDTSKVQALRVAIEVLQTEVVRCKDCKHYGATDCQIQESFYGIKDFDFCSYGERKGGDDTTGGSL